jgi:hypothetical protein
MAAALVLTTSPLRWITLVCFAAGGLARYAITAFPTDLGDRPVTMRGKIHFLLAFVGFGGIATAIGTFAGAAAGSSVWAMASWLDVAGWVVVAAALVMFAATAIPRARPVFGLLERAYYLSIIVWFAATGAVLAGTQRG